MMLNTFMMVRPAVFAAGTLGFFADMYVIQYAAAIKPPVISIPMTVPIVVPLCASESALYRSPGEMINCISYGRLL